ncbi:Uncharacterised protein [Metamycoplasma cloacale]|uniref:Uncharacterized protein n=1 Tax=Metamycoplasma cloacale TaxID=92401 RepID=A0A2Z4LM60_9BACT|nr:hypothetical protein [Metamycoplasma cloacale]AWX42845.1 hypothetical protein DK849_02090 [Metamycoplasma cloacale]VEU79334.1 Uncharacterised protein [Metamycoplasma cloacale]
MKKASNNLVQKTKKQKIWLGIFWTVVPTSIVGILGGAIYFIHKNSRSLEKEFYSPSDFEKEINKIELSSSIEISQNAKTIYNNYLKNKKFKEEQLEKNPNNNLPSAIFDPHKAITSIVSNNLTYNQQRTIIFTYTDLKYNENEPDVLEVFYDVNLNLEYAKGVFEWKWIQNTDKSKYYHQRSQKISFVSWSEDWDSNIEFKKAFSNHEEDIKRIITHRENENDSTGEEWFASEKFQEDVFNWFKNIVIESNVAPNIYSLENYDILAYITKERPYVSWIPTKGLNNLEINYYYQHKTDPKIKSEPRRKIFTINNV